MSYWTAGAHERSLLGRGKMEGIVNRNILLKFSKAKRQEETKRHIYLSKMHASLVAVLEEVL
jgi:hypothetical protein